MKSRQNQDGAFLSKAAKESTQRLYSKPKTVCFSLVDFVVVVVVALFLGDEDL